MNSRALRVLASRLMRHPAAPYHEHAVSAEIKEICRENGLSFDEDAFGNLLIRATVRHRGAPVSGHASIRSSRPIVFAAHMDHPGFDVLLSRQNRNLRVRFKGGVPDHYFQPGLPLRLMPGAQGGKLGRRIGTERVFDARPGRASGVKPAFAVWDLEDFAVRKDRIYGRACDDLIGVASALGALIKLKKSRGRVNAIAAISRAEEVGFHGALALCRSRLLPKNALIISLETSRELPGVEMGKGVILRVGDRTSIFDSRAMRFLSEVAADLQTKHKGFSFQRALMSGGTCEATAYQEYGFQTGAVCVALGNYHNCGPRNRIAPEFVNVSDACAMVDLLIEAARRMPHFKQLVAKLPQRLERMRKEAVRGLRATRGVRSAPL
jgi:putative aminopeptidase FrvX